MTTMDLLIWICWLLILPFSSSTTVLRTVMLVKDSSTKNVKTEVYDVLGNLPTPSNNNLVNESVLQIVNGRTEFKSSLIDNWLFENHTEVSLVVFNTLGDAIWKVTLDGFGSDRTNWFRASRTQSSTDSKLIPDINKLEIIFNSEELTVHRTDNGKGWLWVSYASGQPVQILFSTSGHKTPPSTGYTPTSNAAAVASMGGPSYTLTFNESNSNAWSLHFGGPRYYIGFSLGRLSVNNYLTQFKMAYSADDGCLGNGIDTYTFIKEDDGSDRIFSPNYVSNVASFDMETFYGKCISLRKVDGVGSPGLVVNLYKAQDDYLSGAMFGIQWRFDYTDNPLENAIERIQDDLILNKFETALYRGKFTSAVDNRGSSVFFGVAGISIFLIIILGIILLDLSTLHHQTRFMRRNFKDFKMTVKNLRQKFQSWRGPRQQQTKKVKVNKNGNSSKKGKPNTKKYERPARPVDVKEIDVAVVGKTSVGSPSVITVDEVNTKKGVNKVTGKGNSTKFKSSVKNVLKQRLGIGGMTKKSLKRVSETASVYG